MPDTIDKSINTLFPYVISLFILSDLDLTFEGESTKSNINQIIQYLQELIVDIDDNNIKINY